MKVQNEQAAPCLRKLSNPGQHPAWGSMSIDNTNIGNQKPINSTYMEPDCMYKNRLDSQRLGGLR